MQGRNGEADVENGLVDTVGEGKNEFSCIFTGNVREFMLLNQKFHKCKGSYLPLSKPRGGPVGGAQASPALITRALRCWFSLAPSRLCPEESTA